MITSPILLVCGGYFNAHRILCFRGRIAFETPLPAKNYLGQSQLSPNEHQYLIWALSYFKSSSGTVAAISL